MKWSAPKSRKLRASQWKSCLGCAVLHSERVAYSTWKLTTHDVAWLYVLLIDIYATSFESW